MAREEDPLPATARLNGWLEARYEFWLARSPLQQAYLGLKTDAGKWDDIGDARRKDDLDKVQQELADLKDNFQSVNLSPAGSLSYRLYDDRCQTLINEFPWRHYQCPVNQVDGWQQEIPSVMMNVHGVENVEDAQSYVARLQAITPLIDQVIESMRLAESAGILAPKFAYEHAIRDCRNVISGAPFDAPLGSSPLWADISGKIDRLSLEPSAQQKLKSDAIRVLVTSVRPAFLKLIAACQAAEQRAGTEDGVWRYPNGGTYYASRLAYHTTTEMSAAEIHDFGVSEVERIHGEMQALMQKIGFSGDLKAFFAYLKTDPQFYFPQTPEGKAAYLARARSVTDGMSRRLDEVFLRKPRARLIVRPVEAFREQSATSAFYKSGGAFDNRPGVYYVNTSDMHALPKYELESLAYHEGIPGHHMQIALAQEMDDLPRFRRFADHTAYSEGWAVYAERLAKDMGFYQDPTADFGRLSSELWRACRLVVDTGIHMDDKRWTRNQAMDYLAENTPNAMGDIANSVERYIVDPGQATAYKIGMEKILALREDAKARLGEKFDLRGFHNAVLGVGAVPLTILSDVVEDWIKETL